MEHICKLIANDINRPERGAAFEDGTRDPVVAPFLTLQQQIEEDKKYGKLKPHSGELWYKLLNHDREMTKGETRRGVNTGLLGWEVDIAVNFTRVDISELSDITIEFRDSTEDDLFRDEPNVLAYMYYPFAGDLAGTCVFNSEYPWTINGEPKSGKWIEEHTGKKVQNPENMFQTWSVRKVTRHELGHGLGLPHSHNKDNTMYFSYGGMSDFNTEEDIARMQAKYGVPTTRARFRKVLKKWLRIRFG